MPNGYVFMVVSGMTAAVLTYGPDGTKANVAWVAATSAEGACAELSARYSGAFHVASPDEKAWWRTLVNRIGYAPVM